MINDGNDNYLHPYRGVSLPNDCRSIFTSAVIANYASHDQPGLLRARMWRERAEWAGMSRDVNFWDYLLRVERTGLITGGREGLLVCREQRGATPRGVLTFTHSCQCQWGDQSEAWIWYSDQWEAEALNLTRAHSDWAVHKNIKPMKSSDSPRLFGMMTKLFLPPCFLISSIVFLIDHSPN